MKEILRALALAALLVLPASADEPPIPDQPSAAAMDFVGQFSDAHLSAMLSRIGARQQPMVALSQLHGQMLAAVFDAEIAKSVKQYGPEWQRNLARAWTEMLTDDELTSLRADGADSPHSEKYKRLSATAGQRMQTVSQDLFRKILGETIQNTMQALGNVGSEAPEAATD